MQLGKQAAASPHARHGHVITAPAHHAWLQQPLSRQFVEQPVCAAYRSGVAPCRHISSNSAVCIAATESGTGASAAAYRAASSSNGNGATLRPGAEHASWNGTSTPTASAPASPASMPAPASAPAIRRDRKPRASPAGRSKSDPASLSNIPGVGPANAEKLRQKGVLDISKLIQTHVQQNKADGDLTKQFLQAAGIKNRVHCAKILEYLEKEAHQYAPKVTLSVEGNISAGKSTLLRILESTSLGDKLTLVPEPVEKWQALPAGPQGEGKVNLLDEFYKEPGRYAYTFQNFVFLTRFTQERGSRAGSRDIRLLERSVFSDRMVFVKAVHAAKFMTDTELAVYDSWFDPVLDAVPSLVPDGFVYMRASPERCLERMARRGRMEENSVKLDYLKELHDCHEAWLNPSGWKGNENGYTNYKLRSDIVQAGSSSSRYAASPVHDLTERQLFDLRESMYPADGKPAPRELKTYSSNGTAMQLLYNDNPSGLSRNDFMSGAADEHHKVIQVKVPPECKGLLQMLTASSTPGGRGKLDQVPALMLDCDKDVDLQDPDAFEEHAAMVSNRLQAYSSLVGRIRAARQESAKDGVRRTVELVSAENGPYNAQYMPTEGHAKAARESVVLPSGGSSSSSSSSSSGNGNGSSSSSSSNVLTTA